MYPSNIRLLGAENGIGKQPAHVGWQNQQIGSGLELVQQVSKRRHCIVPALLVVPDKKLLGFSPLLPTVLLQFGNPNRPDELKSRHSAASFLGPNEHWRTGL